MTRFAPVCALFVLTFCPVLADEAAPLRLRADVWMPYNGEPDAAQPGYVIELARLIFPPRGVEVDYQTMPWDDALAAAREGSIDAVIGANSREGQGLVFPVEPIGGPQACLLTRRDSVWKYESTRSFREVKLGVISGYSYWPGLDRYIEQPANAERLFLAESADPLQELMAKLDGREIDVLVDFEAVLLWELRSRGQKPADYRVVYKHEPEPIFIAFSPTDRGRAMAKLLDEGLAELRASGKLESLTRRYGLSDWK